MTRSTHVRVVCYYLNFESSYKYVNTFEKQLWVKISIDNCVINFLNKTREIHKS